jgi:hypothetical protein
VNILEAMTDPELFGKTFKRGLLRGDSWRAWRAFLIALFGLPFDDEAREIFRKHTARSDEPSEQFREAYLVVGRRSGKSRVAALIATFVACFRDYSEVLAPGEIGVLPIIAPDRKQCQIILNYIAGYFDASPTLRSMVKTRLKESIELTNRIRIEVHTASFRSVRGYTAIGCVLDEVAFLRSDDSANPASELIAAIAPAMSTIPDALMLAISSPYSRSGILWEAYRENFGKESPILVWQADTRSMNPTVNRLVIEAAYIRDRAAASAEYGAQFRSDIESFLDIEIVEARMIRQRFELPPSGKSYTAFCDPSGGRNDSMTLAIAHDEEGMAVLDCLRETLAPFSPESVCGEFADVLKRYHLSEVIGDKYGGEWPREQFQKRGISYRIADKTRSELYLELLPGLMSGQVELLDHKRLVTQLVSLERRTARSGKDSVDHPPGGHDDVANAAAGAIVQALRLGAGVGALGVLEYFKRLVSGEIIIPDPQPPIVVRQRTPDPVPACLVCGALCTVKIPGAGVRCNQCGHMDSSGIQQAAKSSRRDPFADRSWRGLGR